MTPFECSLFFLVKEVFFLVIRAVALKMFFLTGFFLVFFVVFERCFKRVFKKWVLVFFSSLGKVWFYRKNRPATKLFNLCEFLRARQ